MKRLLSQEYERLIEHKEAREQLIFRVKSILATALAELGEGFKPVGIASDPKRQEVGRIMRELGEGTLPESVDLSLLKALKYEELEKAVGEKLNREMDEERIDRKLLETLEELTLLRGSARTLLALDCLLQAKGPKGLCTEECGNEHGEKEKVYYLLRGLGWASLALDDLARYEGISWLRYDLGLK